LGAAEVGNHGLLRFGLLFPEAWAALAPWLATWVVSVFMGLLAIAQKDMKNGL